MDTSPHQTCQSTTKAGNPCTGRVYSDGRCYFHHPDSKTAKERGAVAAAERRSERAEERAEAREKARLRPRDAIAAALAENVEQLKAAVRDALDARDHRAIATYLSQAYGTPAQTLQVDDKRSLEDLTPDEVDRELARLLSEAGPEGTQG